MIFQVALNGFVTGLILALPAIAVTLTYGILKFPNFAIGGMLTVGAYLAYALNSAAHLPLFVAAAAASAALSLLLALTDKLVFSKLRDRTSITLLVASIGISFVYENTARFIFGNSPRSFESEIAGNFRYLGLRVNAGQTYSAAAVLIALAGLYVLLYRTALGRAMRATADNASLAAVRGLNREAIIGKVWMIAGLLTGVSGVLAGLDRAVDPDLGSSYLISIFAAAIMGGLGSTGGAVLGALSIGITEELTTLVISPNYREAAGFAAIALVLMFRPQGLFGTAKIRK